MRPTIQMRKKRPFARSMDRFQTVPTFSRELHFGEVSSPRSPNAGGVRYGSAFYALNAPLVTPSIKGFVAYVKMISNGRLETIYAEKSVLKFCAKGDVAIT